MKFENKHLADIEFRRMLDETDTFITKYKSQYLDGNEKEALRKSLEEIKTKLFYKGPLSNDIEPIDPSISGPAIYRYRQVLSMYRRRKYLGST